MKMLDLFGCCRLCLKQDGTVTVNCIEISELCKAVEQVFGFQITLHDKCSTKLCRDCVHKVTSFAMYRDTVLSNQKSLEQYIIINAKLTSNSEVKDDDSDVILIENNDEKSLDSPKISDGKVNEVPYSSEDDIPLMRLIGDQKKHLTVNTDIKKNQIDDTIKNQKTPSRSVCARKKTRYNYTGLRLKHFKNSIVKVRRLNEADLRRLSKSYNQLKIQEEESNVNQSEFITPFREVSSTPLFNSKLNSQGKDGTIVAKLLSAVSKQENTQNRPFVINRDIIRTKSMEETKVIKHSPVKFVQIPIHDKIAQNQAQIRSDNNDLLAHCTTEQAEVNTYVSNLITQLVRRPRAASITDPTDKDVQNSVNDSNVKVSNNEICNIKQNQAGPKPTLKTIEASKDARAGRRNYIAPINKKIRPILPKLPSAATPDKNMLTIQNDNKHSVNAISHVLSPPLKNDKSSNEIETIDLTHSTLVNIKASSSSNSNQHLVSQVNVNQSTNNSLGFCDKNPHQSEFLLDHTYNLVGHQVPQYNISPLYQYSAQNIESKEETRPMQLQIQPKPTNSAQISTIPNKTAVTDTQIGNNSPIAPQNLQDRQSTVLKFANIQFKEIKPKPPISAQVSTMPNKTEVASAQSVPVSNSTHLPQNQDRRVKVLTVNELNMRAAGYTQYESLPRKLPIRITLVKVQNEVQIKLTDSNNKDINFHDLTSAEQLAVKSSLIEPSCKEQILSAIKTCSPDQYSAILLRCVGFTSGEIS